MKWKSRKFVGVCFWSVVYLAVVIKNVFFGATPDGWTFLTASLTPITAGVWSVYMGVNVIQHFKK